MTLAEQETIYRYDMEERLLWGYTTHEPTMRMWKVKGFTPEGDGPRGWRIKGPIEALRLRKVSEGKVCKKRATDAQRENMRKVRLAKKLPMTENFKK